MARIRKGVGEGCERGDRTKWQWQCESKSEESMYRRGSRKGRRGTLMLLFLLTMIRTTITVKRPVVCRTDV